MERIRRAFFVDQLRLTEGPQMTATEVLQRTEDQMRLLAPVMGRQQSELLRPLVSRTFEIMMRRELLLPAPEELEGRQIDIQYSSLIAKAQRVQEAQSITRTLEQAAAFIQLDPTVVDNLDGDQAILTIARVHGLPQEIIRNKDEVEGIRQARQEAQQQAAEQQQQAQQAETVSKVGPAVAQLSQAGA